MAARAIWKGVITFGDVRAPVKLYSAVQDRNIHFHLLHDQDMVRIRQRMVNPATGAEVELGSAKRGLEIEAGRFVLVSDADLKFIEPQESRDIAIDKFVDPGDVGHEWYERPYFLGPDEKGERDYWSVVQALSKAKKEGVAHWVMRRRDYTGLLRVEKGYLMLVATRHPDEVVPASELEGPTGRKTDAKELKMAEQLVDALADKFDPTQYRDEYRDRVMELIERKAKGEHIKIKRPERKPATRSLVSALQASLDAARKEKAHV